MSPEPETFWIPDLDLAILYFPLRKFEKTCPTQEALHSQEVAPEHLGPLHPHRFRQPQAWAGAPTLTVTDSAPPPQLWRFRNHMTTVRAPEETRRWEKGKSSHTQLVPTHGS